MEKEELDQKAEKHICKQSGWWTDCELEPSCNWLEDTKVRGYPWGCE